jgi:putative hemolysin
MPNLGTPERSNETPALVDLEAFSIPRMVRRFLPMQRVKDLYVRARYPEERPLLENLLREMRVEYQVAEGDLARVPRSGGAIVAANHPFGLLDGAILGCLLGRVRPDVRILTNFLLAGIPELHDHCFFVDPFGHSGSVGRNRRALHQSLEWLKSGGLLVIFPAGEVSHIQLPQMAVADPRWNPAVARLARLSGAVTVPAFVGGRNSATFQAMGFVNPNLRTTWLLNEFLAQTDKKVTVRIGNPIPAEVLSGARDDESAATYLRWRTYLLSQRHRAQRIVPDVLKGALPLKKEETIAEAIEPALLLGEIMQLGGECLLEQNRDFEVYIADSGQIPNLLKEIGRLRELTFREVGEGSGKCCDLDRFDAHYKHLVLWSKQKQEVAGAYRLGLTIDILPRLGIEGLYSSTLFRYDPEFFERMGPAIELGRSFIRLEYQRQFAPLLMIWKGIGRYLASTSGPAILFGAVSISSRYNRISRELIVRFFEAQEQNRESPEQIGQELSAADLARWITPRNRFRPKGIKSADCRSVCAGLSNLQELSDPIADVESDGKSVPILLKHYAKLGGRLISFNIDRNFSNVLDGFVLVDLRRSNPAVLARYMGQDGLGAFQRYHHMSPCEARAATAGLD